MRGQLPRFQHHCVAQLNSWFRNAFQIHLLQLSDGRPHPLATADQAVFHIDRWERKAIKTVSISERRLAVVVDDSHWDNSDIFVWDWRDGRMVSVSLLDFDSW